ncbi:MAG TPA: cation:proton antiporter [Terrimicrobiaceae bacterium]|nr:cation:proton antiporter [Terrimicrobiaceae bacterium]
MELLEVLRSQVLALPALAKFAIVIAVIAGVPPLARRIGLPEMVGLLLFGVLLGPHVLGFFGEDRPVADFFAELGKLLLMFSAGLEIDIALFRKAQNRAIIFGLATTIVPLLLGTLLSLAFGYSILPAIVVGSLLASHTLLGLSIVRRLGATRLEPVIVTIGATVLSDTLSLIVFAVCISTYLTGFSIAGLGVQLIEIAVFVPLILFGLSRVGAYALSKVRSNEDAEFVLMLGIMAIAGVLADFINLPGIVGAFLAGLAVNAATRERAAKAKLDFFGKALFIPCFFVATGFLIDPIAFAHSVVTSLPLVVGIIATLVVGKWIAAIAVGQAFGYLPATRLTMWALTLPQVAATLAATLVAHHTVNANGQRLLDERMLNAVLVLMVATSVLGPLLTERFAPRMLESETEHSGGLPSRV